MSTDKILNDISQSWALIISAAIPSLAWFVKQAWGEGIALIHRKRQRREALIRLFLEAQIQLEELASKFTEDDKERLINIVDSENDFRPYIAIYNELNISKEIMKHIASLPDREILAIIRYLEHAGLFHLYYSKLESNEFVSLSKDRKKNVIEELFKIGKAVESSINELSQVVGKNHQFLPHLDINSDPEQP